MKKWFPVMLDMEGRKVVVVGGGAVAARRAGELAGAGAGVTVISPDFHPDLMRMIESGQVRAIRSRYTGPGQLQGAWLAVAATGDGEVNREVCRDAERLGILWNDASDAERSALLVPRTIRRGRLVIAVSTSGASPGLAKRIAAEIGERFGEEYAEYAEFLAELREKAKRRVKDEKRRKMIFESALKSDILESIEKNRAERAKWIERLLENQLPSAAETESKNETTDRGGHQTKRPGADSDESGDRKP